MYQIRAAVKRAVQLALAIAPAVAWADSINPSTITATLPVGASATVTKILTLDPGTPTSSKVDVFFLSDTTGSMGGAISAVQAAASSILTDAAALGDVAFGVGEYKDEFDSYVYRLNQDITTSQADVQTGINVWGAFGGDDWPEAQLFALQELANNTAWRPGSARILVWFGDAPGHDPSIGGATETTATAALVAKKIAVEAIDVGPPGDGLDYLGQATRIAAATGGTYSSGINAATIVQAIKDAITTAIQTYTTVSIDASEVPAGVTVAVTPGSYVGSFDRSITRVFNFEVKFTADTAGLYSFNLYGTVDGGQVATESDTIEVAGEGCITVDIYKGYVESGGGTPYSDLAGSFTTASVSFATATSSNWHPFGLDSFGAEINGYLDVAADGTYPFTLDSDDGSLLLIDGALVVDNGGAHPPAVATGSAVLTAGTHCFEVQFFECCSGPSGLDLVLPEGVTYGCTPPPCKLTCPSNLTVCSEPGRCAAVVDYPAPSTTCGCIGPVTCTPPAGSDFVVGTHPVTCVATDDTGVILDQCTFTVTVQVCGKCPLSQGYWKNHSAWPVNTLTLGSISYTQGALLDLLKKAVGAGNKADASLILAYQLIAAKLNVLNGSEACPIADTIAAADALIGSRTIPITPKVTPNTADGARMVALAGMLEKYNTAQLSTGCTP